MAKTRVPPGVDFAGPTNLKQWDFNLKSSIIVSTWGNCKFPIKLDLNLQLWTIEFVIINLKSIETATLRKRTPMTESSKSSFESSVNSYNKQYAQDASIATSEKQKDNLLTKSKTEHL